MLKEFISSTLLQGIFLGTTVFVIQYRIQLYYQHKEEKRKEAEVEEKKKKEEEKKQRKEKEHEEQQKKDEAFNMMRKAIFLIIKSSTIQIHAIKKLKDDNGKPLINGELEKLDDKLSEFYEEFGDIILELKI